MLIDIVACILQDWIEEEDTTKGKDSQARQGHQTQYFPESGLPIRPQRAKWSLLNLIRDKLPGVGGCVSPDCSCHVPGTWAESRLWFAWPFGLALVLSLSCMLTL